MTSPIVLDSLVVLRDGVSSLSGMSGTLGDYEGSTNNYYQVQVRNQSNGNNASGDFIVTSDTGSNTTGYVDLGINGSGFSQGTWTINKAGEPYLYSQSNNFSIGTASAKTLNFFTGGTLAANERLKIDGSGNITFDGLTTNNGLYAANSSGYLSQVLAGNANTISGGYINTDSTKVPFWYDTTSGDRKLVTPTYLSSFGYGTGSVTSIIAGNGMTGGTVTSTGTFNIDSTKIPFWYDTSSGFRKLVTPTYLSSFGYGTGSVTSVAAGTGLSGGTITTTGTISMPSVGTAATYGSSTIIPEFTTDAEGRVSSVTTVTCTPAIGSITGFGTGVESFLVTPTSANLATALTDETGTGSSVFATNPTFAGFTVTGGDNIVLSASTGTDLGQQQPKN